MALLECPKCGTRFPTDNDWAKSAVSTLVVAPAVQDMATQVRCPKCHHLFAESEVRYSRAPWSKGLSVSVALVGAIVIIWAVYRLLTA